MLSIDTEDTGKDIFNGARPFFVTVCCTDGTQRWWEWPVDPLTRKPRIPVDDLDEIQREIDGADELVLQNAKFDFSALKSVIPGLKWDWSKVQDCLIAGHLLASNQPHDLTSMALQYMGIDILPFEKALKEACTDARRIVKNNYPEWRIAQEGLSEMPGAKKSADKKRDPLWKYDSWLPKALAERLKMSDDHCWHTVLRDYSNADSAVTIALWQSQESELKRRGLIKIYREKMRAIPALAEMEERGVTFCRARLDAIGEEYVRESEEAARTCINIAAPFELTLPKAGANKSLEQFCFGDDAQNGEQGLGVPYLNLPVLRRTKKNQKPSLDQNVLAEYLTTLPPRSRQLLFIKALAGKRKKDKSLEFFEAYKKFGVPLGVESYQVLHPSLNSTGTGTTRLSCSNPNLQQVSKQETACGECLGEGGECKSCSGTGEDLHSVRKIFGPAPGREWWTADAQNIELRIPAYESGEPELIALFERPGDPPFYGSQHLLNFSIVYNDIWQRELRAVGIEKVGPHCKKKYGSNQYHWVKCGGLAMQYQCGEDTADRTFRRKGGYRKLKDHFTRLNALNHKWVSFAEKNGYVETIPDKTVDPDHGYPLLCTRTERGRILPTVPLNYRTQGSAGWWMVKAIIRCYMKLKTWRVEDGFSGFMALTVHDELIFDFPRALQKLGNRARIEALRKLMEEGGNDMGIPTPVSIEYHVDNWSEGEVI